MERRATSRPKIKADIYLFSGCQDGEKSAEIKRDSNDMSAGAGTTTFLAALAALHAEQKGDKDQGIPLNEILFDMRKSLKQLGHAQVPQLSTSTFKNLSRTRLNINLGRKEARTRALLIGINYEGTEWALRGCHNDVRKMRGYLTQNCGFSKDPEHMRLLIDDGVQETPTYTNILAAMKWLVDGAKPGDSLFLHFAGHGGSVIDDNGDEEDGKDETLYPADHATAGQIRDDLLYDIIVHLPAGCQLVSVFDCCHSGSVLDLPFEFKATDVKCKRGKKHIEKQEKTVQTEVTSELVRVVLMCAATALLKYKFLGGRK